MVDSKERQVGEKEAAVWLGRMMAIFLVQMDHGHIVKADQKVRSWGYNVEIENKALKMASFLTISFGLVEEE